MNSFTFVPEGVRECMVTAFLQTEMNEMKVRGGGIERRPAVLICPGGAYEAISEREGEPVAKEYFSAGYHAFILQYSVGKKAVGFEPLMQLAAAMAHIRKCADEWMVDDDKIAVCGFSAGGHLAASLGTLYQDEKFLKTWKRAEKIRPNAMILGYPVITADEFAHKGSLQHISASDEGSEEYAYFGLNKHVDGQTPPTYLWHTSADEGVSVENSLRFASALSAAKVPFELHVFPFGEHGMSVCTKEVGCSDPYNARWMEWSIKWLDRLFSFEK